MRNGSVARGGRPVFLSCRCPLRWSLERIRRARCRLCSTHTCKLSHSVYGTLLLQLSLVRRWRTGSTRRIRRAWEWVQGERVRQGMDCHDSLCNRLCTVHVHMMDLHMRTLSLWGLTGRRRCRTRCRTCGVQARVRGALALHGARRAHQGWSSTKRALLPRSLVSVQHSVLHGRM